jgi:hypothetical protein
MRKFFASTILLASLSTSVFAAGPYGSINYGHWKGGAYIDDKTGAFSNCIVSAPYLSGINMYVLVDKNAQWSLGFSKNSWRLEKGSQFPIVLTFDGNSPVKVTAVAINHDLLFVPMPDDSQLIRDFRKSRRMSAYAAGQLFQFNLDGTSVILPSLANCVKIMRAGGLAAASDFVLRPMPRQTATIAPATGSTLTPNGQPSQEYQVEAVELAYNFLMKAKLPEGRVLSRAETPVELASYGAVWKAGDTTGFVRVIPGDVTVKGLDVAATVIGNDAKACKGKFASGRMSEMVDSEIVFRGFASCEDSDGARGSQYFIVPRQKGGFVLFSVQMSPKVDQSNMIDNEAKITDFRKAAVVSVSAK